MELNAGSEMATEIFLLCGQEIHKPIKSKDTLSRIKKCKA